MKEVFHKYKDVVFFLIIVMSIFMIGVIVRIGLYYIGLERVIPRG